MQTYCFDIPIIVDDYLVDQATCTDCLIRKKRIVLYPEEIVRQSFLRYLLDILNLDTTKYSIKVEYRNLDIVIYRNHLLKDFQPATEPVLIVELKNEYVDVLGYEQQLINYLSINFCENGVLSNCKQLFLYSKQNNFKRRALKICELLCLFEDQNWGEDVLLFESAKQGELFSFLELIDKFGQSNVFTFQCSDYGAPIQAFLLNHSDEFVFFDFCGVKSKRKKPKIRKGSFIKLLSIRG
jgi:hypothetical protein